MKRGRASFFTKFPMFNEWNLNCLNESSDESFPLQTNPSTSLLASMDCVTTSASMVGGSGSCTNIPCTEGSPLHRRIKLVNFTLKFTRNGNLRLRCGHCQSFQRQLYRCLDSQMDKASKPPSQPSLSYSHTQRSLSVHPLE